MKMSSRVRKNDKMVAWGAVYFYKNLKLTPLFLVFIISLFFQAKVLWAQELSSDRANQEFTNPASQFPFFIVENDYFLLNGDFTDKTRPSNLTLVEPVIPIPIGDTGWTAITRPILPIVGRVDVPVPDPATGGVSFLPNESGLADVTLFSIFTAPNAGQGFIWGVGPTTKFPTATSSTLGNEKWQAGPVGLAMYTTPKFTVGVLAQHWWDYAGDSAREDVSLSNIQYFFSYTLSPAWSIAAGPIISIDHEATDGNKYSVPIGVGIARGFKLGDRPARFLVEADYYVEQRDDYGPEWNIRAVIGVMLPPIFGN
jgi:hypothetical protein